MSTSPGALGPYRNLLQLTSTHVHMNNMPGKFFSHKHISCVSTDCPNSLQFSNTNCSYSDGEMSVEGGQLSPSSWCDGFHRTVHGYDSVCLDYPLSKCAINFCKSATKLMSRLDNKIINVLTLIFLSSIKVLTKYSTYTVPQEQKLIEIR